MNNVVNNLKNQNVHDLNNQLFKVSLLVDAIRQKVEPMADSELNELLERIQIIVQHIATFAQPSMQQ